MKSTILILLATLVMANAAFAIDDPVTVKAPNEAHRPVADPVREEISGTPIGLDLSNVPPHLRWLVNLAWMLSKRMAATAPCGA